MSPVMRLLLLLTATIAISTPACTITDVVTMPYCPVSDSAWKKVDSIPAICVFDTVSQRRRKP